MTLDHAFWTYFFSRKKKRLAFWFVLGSISPDLIYFMAFLYMAAQEAVLNPELVWNVVTLAISGYSPDALTREAFEVINQLVAKVFGNPIVTHVRYSNHSLLLWGIVFLCSAWATGFRQTAWRAFLIGWGGHVLVDLMTHVTDSTPPFYPLSDRIVPGMISYWNPAFHGDTFHKWNVYLIGLAFLFLSFERWRGIVARKRRWNERRWNPEEEGAP